MLTLFGEIAMGVCAAVFVVAYWVDARRRDPHKHSRILAVYAKIRPLSRSTTESRD